MKIKLYSDAHINAARRLYPDKFIDDSWLNLLWTDEEINACKFFETESLIS